MDKEKEIKEMGIELYEEMNAKIADIITIGGTNADYYASAYIKALRAENAKLKAENLRLSTELAHCKEDLAHADENVFYREMAVKLDEDKIKQQTAKEIFDKILDAYQYVDYYEYLLVGIQAFADEYGVEIEQ